MLFLILLIDGDFNFASYYNYHMVLQRAPVKATLWAVNNLVTVNFNDKKYDAVYIKGNYYDILFAMLAK